VAFVVEWLRMQRTSLAVAVSLAIGTSHGAAYAQVGQPAQVAPAPIAPDVVRLKSGAFVRGTIVEHDPGRKTVLQTDAERRTFEAAEIAYAGPATRDPFVGSTVPVLPPDANPVQLRSTEGRLSFYLYTTSFAVGDVDGGVQARAFRPLCTAPCAVMLAPGSYRMALSLGDSPPLLTRGNVLVGQRTTLTGTLVSRWGTRAAGVLLAIAGGVLLIPTIVYAPREDSDKRLVVAGGILGGASFITGLVLAVTDDRVGIVSDAPAPAGGLPPSASRRPLGASFSGRF
jgi:hypothetical protein